MNTNKYGGGTMSSVKKLPKRTEIDPNFKWKLEDIYETDSLWESDFLKVKDLAKKIVEFKGTLNKSANRLLECLVLNDEMLSINDKVYMYAKMRRDEDNKNPVYQSLTDRAQSLATQITAAQSFIIPEILSINEGILKRFLQHEKGLQIYSHYFDELFRQKKHILSEKEEEILALSGEVCHAPQEIFTMFNNADIRFPTIKDDAGNEIELTKGNYSKFIESKKQYVRKNAFDVLYGTYNKHINTVASALISNLKAKKFNSKVRKYDSSLESSLNQDNIQICVYDNLIDTINSNMHLLHKYLRLRKKALKLNKLHMYDLYVPIVEEPNKNIPYDEALKIVRSSLYPLGDEYLSYLDKGFSSSWIDIYENEGKTSGAYSWGTYKTHPYILLNYQGTTHDVFTIAHEIGHALHSFYTNKTQPYIYSDYKIFVAEVASTVNETFLFNHLIKTTESLAQKKYLLNQYLEGFRTTVFRQVMFAEFEKIIHQKMWTDEALTTQSLNSIYLSLNEKYYGKEVIIDNDISIEWSRIPHFYSSFYVYKYATGFSSAVSLVEGMLKDGVAKVPKYIEFLKGGNRDYPLNLLNLAGVDLTTAKPINDALKVFDNILNELEGLI